MKAAHQYITDIKGNKVSVILPVKDYQRLLDALEEKEDVRLYDAVKSKKEQHMPLEEYIKLRKKKKHA
jgi:hypothetical protein